MSYDAETKMSAINTWIQLTQLILKLEEMQEIQEEYLIKEYNEDNEYKVKAAISKLAKIKTRIAKAEDLQKRLTFNHVL